MGDAGLSKDRKSAYLHMSHSIKQVEYALWKKEILEQLTSVATWYGKVKSGKSDKEYGIIRLWTKRHPIYTSLKERMYFQNRRTFDLHCLKRLSDLGLLIWFLDDGVRYWKHNGHDPSAMLCTDRYNYIEHLSLQKYFHDRWNLNAKLNRHGIHWRLRFGVNELDKLDKLFEPFASSIPDCMKYKLSASYERPEWNPEETVQTDVINP